MTTKAIFTTSVLALALHATGLAQTADAFVTQGRAFLVNSNILAANASFSNAVVRSPTHPAANAFYAATRILVLPSLPVGSNFLTRLGLPAAGRNIYQWTSEFPTNADGSVIAPAGVNVKEAVLLLRTNILPAFYEAEINLSRITNPSFTLNLLATETQGVAVTIDYGDIQMMRALLRGAQYFCYTVYSWNLDAQLTALQQLYNNDQLTVEQILRDYPQVLTFATTNGLSTAQNAFTNGVGRYLAAINFILARPTNTTRLFNYSYSKSEKEERFRETLQDLRASITAPVPLDSDPGLTIDITPISRGTFPIRSFLPRFSGNGFLIGTLPDGTFGGVVAGGSVAGAEKLISRHVDAVPRISPPFLTPNQELSFSFTTIEGKYYEVLSSFDLINWDFETSFIGEATGYDFTDPYTSLFEYRYFRVAQYDNEPFFFFSSPFSP